MILAFSILFGIVLGLVLPVSVPSGYSQYVAIIILASLDSVFGAMSAWFNKNFDIKIFFSGFFGNTIIAVILTFIGKKLDVDLYLVALIVFGTRLFTNFSSIRRLLLLKLQEKTKKLKKNPCN
ncbi:MAG: small basic family protein [Clostridia bacterium]|nr:small basic family protein [Clostridia bacterium]